MKNMITNKKNFNTLEDNRYNIQELGLKLMKLTQQIRVLHTQKPLKSGIEFLPALGALQIGEYRFDNISYRTSKVKFTRFFLIEKLMKPIKENNLTLFNNSPIRNAWVKIANKLYQNVLKRDSHLETTQSLYILETPRKKRRKRKRKLVIMGKTPQLFYEDTSILSLNLLGH